MNNSVGVLKPISTPHREWLSPLQIIALALATLIMVIFAIGERIDTIPYLGRARLVVLMFLWFIATGIYCLPILVGRGLIWILQTIRRDLAPAVPRTA